MKQLKQLRMKIVGNIVNPQKVEGKYILEILKISFRVDYFQTYSA